MDNDANAVEMVKRVLLGILVKINIATIAEATLNDPIMMVCSLGAIEVAASSDTNC